MFCLTFLPLGSECEPCNVRILPNGVLEWTSVEAASQIGSVVLKVVFSQLFVLISKNL